VTCSAASADVRPALHGTEVAFSTSAIGAPGDIASNVSMAPGVVAVSSATVAANLVSASADGNTFVFKSAAGALGQLAPGKVMLLQGYTAAVVVSVAHAGGRLTVTTKPAALTDIFKNADISFDQPIDFANTFTTLSPGTPPSEAAEQPGTFAPVVLVSRAGLPALPKVGLSYTGKGPGDFTYKISVSPTLSQLNWALEGCLGASFFAGNSCGTTKSAAGMTLSATLSGYIAKARLSGDFDIANGRNVHSEFSFLSTGGVQITYTILDPEKGNFNLPVLRLPISFNIPFAVGPVPMLLKVTFALLIKVALAAKNSTVQGGEKLTYGGAETVSESGGTDSGTKTPLKIAGSFLTNKPSITLASSAVEVAAQMKVGFGPGLPVGNILGYGDVITALGQRTGTAVAGLPCSAFYLTVSGHAYMEAQVAIWKIASAPVELFSISHTDPRAEC
jgi:hypothetical protein